MGLLRVREVLYLLVEETARPFRVQRYRLGLTTIAPVAYLPVDTTYQIHIDTSLWRNPNPDLEVILI